jgi:hypothetical protein
VSNPSVLQYRRVCNLVVGALGQGVEVSDLRISFRVVKTITSEPNEATIKVYNFSESNEAFIKSLNNGEGTDVILNAGYAGAALVVFKGQIKNAFHYRQKTDLITEIEAGDGSKDMHNSYVNVTLAAGTTDTDLINACVSSFNDTTKGNVVFTDKRRSKGRAVFGSTKHILGNLSKAKNSLWSIQDGQLQFIGATSVLPSEAIVVNSQTGMLETPELTDKGINVKMLLNPQVRCNGVIQLNNNDIKFRPRIRHAQASSGSRSASITKPRTPVKLDPDGLYKVIRVDLRGDTRGHDSSWTTDVICIGVGQPIPTSDSLSSGGGDE